MRALRRIINVSGSDDIKFWVSHLIILLGTVLGVYLAASAGLKTAIQFDLIRSDRESYYMRSAMRDELVDNIEKVEKWGNDYRGGNAKKYIGNPEAFKLDDYVWITMQEAQGTFEIPSDILTSVRRYYVNTSIYLLKMTSKDGAAEQVDNMLNETKKIKSETLQLLEADVEKLAARLERVGIKP